VVQMKKIFIIIFAIICAFYVTEEVISLFLNFPKFGVEKKVLGITSLVNRGEIYKPYSSYVNNEDGYKIFRRNNEGLPGTDIINSDTSRYLLVLGNSFVEGYQVRPDSLATSKFQRLCDSYSPKYQVVNLGVSGHDAMDLWLRVNYFEKIFPPSGVFLVITEFNLFNHQGTLDFALPSDFGRNIESPGMKIKLWIRNTSSYINLLATAYKYYKGINESPELETGDISPDWMKQVSADTSLNASLGLGRCLLEYRNQYGNKFIAVSILQDANQNNAISGFCGANHIHFKASPILVPQYEIKGSGHLTTEGNTKLGELLYESRKEYLDK